jgi:high-affinity nickel permease
VRPRPHERRRRRTRRTPETPEGGLQIFGLDERIADLSGGASLLVIVGIAVLLGVRHATDPDHLTAVSTLVAAECDRSRRRAAALGLAWGLGHATTLFVFGLPIVLFDDYLPAWFTRAAEVLIGLVIMALALRLLLRWRAGYFHVHVHAHDGAVHEHVHVHDRRVEHQASAHEHVHRRPVRSRLGAYGIGLIHGIGGSAGVGILLLAAIPNRVEGFVALLVFAAFTAVSMTVASTCVGSVLSSDPVRSVFGRVAPVLGVASLAFGVWYALGAVEAVPYMF